MHRLAEIPGIARLRYITSHPRDMDDDLIAAHRDLPALMPQLHLPVQSGSDRILEAMNRHHTRADYLRLIERLRRARPDLAFSSDFIVGFPGETEDDFADTLRLMAEVGYASAFSFKYSPRPARPPPTWIRSRKPRRTSGCNVCKTTSSASGRFMSACVGQTFDVLFEKHGRHPGQVVGRSRICSPCRSWRRHP